MHPVLFKIGAYEVRNYGVFIALAFLVGFFLLYKEARRRGYYADKILDLELLLLVSGIIGARSLHVLVNYGYYGKNLPDMFLIWRGGLAFYGGLALAIPAAWAFIIKNKMPLWETADFIVPYVALGQSIGRIGCFFNRCCFGKPCTVPVLGVMFPGDATQRHPAQLYASLALLSIFVILRLAQKKQLFNGFIFGLYLFLYSFQRFFIDFLRGDTPRYAFNLTVSQVISVTVFAATIFLLCRMRKWKY